MQNASLPDSAENPFGQAVTSPVDLAARLAARLCHDFISPASAIVSGLDLIEDPEQQDMREEAMSLISASARKLAALLSFSRVAFGGSASAESFDVRELEQLARGLFEHMRAELVWQIEPPSLEKPAARALLNLAQLGGSALPMGGRAILTGKTEDGALLLWLDAEGARARLRAEAVDGLNGQPFSDGLAGYWVQTYFLQGIVVEAGGSVALTVEDEAIRVRIRMPAG